jgi:hypothetical protein
MVSPVGAFVEGKLYLSWMQVFSKPFLPFIFILFVLFILFIQGLIGGHCLGVVTRDDNFTHKYLHRNDKAGK